MALVDCDALCGLADPEALKSAVNLPDPAQLGLPMGLTQELSARAAAMPADVKAMVSAKALAAVAVVGGGTLAARGGALMARARDRMQGASDAGNAVLARAEAAKQAAAGLASGPMARLAAAKQAAAEAQAKAAALASGAADRLVAAKQGAESAVAAPKAMLETAAAAVKQAAEKAQGQAAAIEAAVREKLAAGVTDPAALAQAAAAMIGPVPPEPAAMSADIQARLAAAESAAAALPAAGAPVLPPVVSSLRDRWGSLRTGAATAAGGAASGLAGGLPAAASGLAGVIPAMPGWGLGAPSLPQTPLGMPALTGAGGGLRGLAAGMAANRWQSLRGAMVLPVVPQLTLPAFQDPWTDLFSDDFTPPAFPQLPPFPALPAPPAGPLAPPPFDLTAMAALASMAAMFRARFGFSLARPGALSDLAETMESFNDCMADQQPMDPGAMASLDGWGSLARAVGSVRDQMGVNLTQPNMGQAFSDALAARQAAMAGGIAAWQEQRAQTILNWMPLDQAASALDMPVSGFGALSNLGSTLQGLADADLPDCSNLMGTASLLSSLQNLRSIRDSFGVNALSSGAADRLRGMGQTVRDNLSGRMAGLAAAPSAAWGLTHAALDRFSRIDRSQMGDLGLGGMTMDNSPALASAPPVLGTISAAEAVRQRPVTRNGQGRPRRRSGRRRRR